MYRIQLMSVGLAAVIDTVLVLALAERRNWQRAAAPIVAIVMGAWLLHAGAFTRLLLIQLNSPGARQIHLLAFMMMNLGLLLIPSGMAHACLRLLSTGLHWGARSRVWYVIAYLPMFVLMIMSFSITDDPRADYIELTTPLRIPYAIWSSIVYLGSAICFWQMRHRVDIDRARQFFTLLAVLQLFSGIMQAIVLLYAIKAWPKWQHPLELVVLLAPTLLATVFGYFVVRFNFMQIMLERTFVYAAIVVAFSFLHYLVARGLQPKLEDHFRVDFGILEAIVVMGLIIAYQPLRHRVAEALRYLLGARVSQIRQQTRDLATQLSSLAGREPRELLVWFCQAVERVLDLKYISAWLFDATDRPTTSCGVKGPSDAHAIEMFQAMKHSGEHIWTSRLPKAYAQLMRVDGEMAIRFEQPAATGMLVFGRRGGNREFSEEEVGAVALLVEQLGLMLHNSWLQSERLNAERRALQNEKLSTLGLLASSIAHEIKNPLSSIKTIAAVLAEDLGSEHPRAEDVRLILGEVDRLAVTTSQLLSFVRPAGSNGQSCSVHQVLESILSVMRHWARERGVRVECQFDTDADHVDADEAALREVFFNLLQNSIEAAGRDGCVRIVCRREEPTCSTARVVVEIHDSGPGIASDVQDRLFEPFVTTKAGGTGLGLYLVGQRIRDLGGEVHCRSDPNQGTQFTVAIPVTHHHNGEKQ